MSELTKAFKMEAELAKDYPSPIRELYTGALRKDHPSDRHRQLLRLGEASLAYLAALAFADYHRARVGDPVPEVEAAVRGIGRATTGDYLRLFRISQRGLGRDEIFGIRRYEVDVKLEYAQRLTAAIKAVEHAQRIGAQDIQRAVEEGLRDQVKTVRWLGFWNHFVEYRNRVIHADDKGWPVDAPGYYEVMTPFLEAALVEALRTEYIAHVLLEYPVAELISARRSRDGWSLRLDGEYQGAPLTEVSTKEPPETWQSDLGAKYVLSRINGEWAIYSRFYDLRAGDAPGTPKVGEHPMVADQNDAVDRTDAYSRSGDTGESGGPLAPRPHRLGSAAEQPVRVGSPSSERVTTWNLPASREQTNTPAPAGSPRASRETPTRSAISWTNTPAPARSPRAATWHRRAAAFALDQVAIWTITFVVLATSIAAYGENSDVPLIFLFGGLLLATVAIAVYPARRSGHAGQPSGSSYLGSGRRRGQATF